MGILATKSPGKLMDIPPLPGTTARVKDTAITIELSHEASDATLSAACVVFQLVVLPPVPPEAGAAPVVVPPEPATRTRPLR